MGDKILLRINEEVLNMAVWRLIDQWIDEAGQITLSQAKAKRFDSEGDAYTFAIAKGLDNVKTERVCN